MFYNKYVWVNRSPHITISISLMIFSHVFVATFYFIGYLEVIFFFPDYNVHIFFIMFEVSNVHKINTPTWHDFFIRVEFASLSGTIHHRQSVNAYLMAIHGVKYSIFPFKIHHVSNVYTVTYYLFKGTFFYESDRDMFMKLSISFNNKLKIHLQIKYLTVKLYRRYIDTYSILCM